MPRPGNDTLMVNRRERTVFMQQQDTANRGPVPVQPQPPCPPPYPPVVPPLPRQRRVGTFTLGLSLILIGVLIPLCFFLDNRWIRFFQFAPIVLVFLGIEVLYYAIRYKEGKLKYDGLSIFLVLFLTILSLMASAVIPFVSNAISLENYVRDKDMVITRTIEDTAAMNQYSLSTYVACDGYRSELWAITTFDPSDPPGLSIYVNFDDIGIEGEPDQAQIEKAVGNVVEAVRSTGENISQLEVGGYLEEEGCSFAARFQRSDLQHFNADLLEQRLDFYY